MCAKKKKMLYDTDKWLLPYKDAIDKRQKMILEAKERLSKDGSLSKGMNNHIYYGLHHDAQGNWVFREWAPNATKIYLIGDFNNWKRSEAYALRPMGGGNWEITLPAMFLDHGALYKLFIEWPGGGAERLPSYVTRTVQDVQTKQFCAQVWDPVKPYEWRYPKPGKRPHPLIYECHIGMATEEERVGTFEEFRLNVLPKVADLGYDTIQIMALQEHPYYGSFGYQVANFYALSSRFGTPEEFKAKIDADEFLEYEEVYTDRYYGTLKSQVEEQLKNGKNVIFDIDIKGGINVKKFYGEHALSLFIQPPGIDELRKRLVGRATDSPEQIEERLAKAEYEMSFAPQFDRIIVNDELEAAKAETLETINNFLNKE